MSVFSQTWNYHYPTPIRFGPGVIHGLPAYCQEHNLNRPMLVTDPNVAQLDFFQKIYESLKAAGLSPSLFTDMHANPVKSDVIKGGEAYATADADAIIGIGGGASMDVARAIALRINHHRDLFDYDDLIGGDIYVTEEVPHFITVPTTAGTGSEVGRSAIISEDETKRKRILFSPKLMARMVFADPELTYGLPPHITAATGMDALTHNLEAYLAKGFHPMADGIALEGIRLIWEALPKVTLSPSPESRSKMLIASLMGAVAFQKGLGIVHSLAHPLSTLLDMHHGLANAIMLPYGMAYNIPGQEDRFARLAQTIGLSEHNGEAFLQALERLRQQLDIPANLSEAGVSASHIDRLAELAEQDFCHPSNPRPVSKEDFRSIYSQALD